LITSSLPSGVANRCATPSFFRRLAAIFYDSCLLLAIWFIATAIILPFNHGIAFRAEQWFYPLYLLVISFIFYGWFWTHGGQTLGLRSWKITVKTLDQNPLNWRQALIRFTAALLSWGCMGLGFMWIIIDKKGYAWHDYLSKTALFLD
jgi:uncharacterized RDD family membrane protein YckC